MASMRGTVQGEAARRYAGFTYRRPVLEPVTLHSVDPHRLNPLHEFPRDTCMDEVHIKTVELADFEVRIHPREADGMSNAEVWMLPNEYTATRERMRVLEVRVGFHPVTVRRVLDELAQMAFRAPTRGPCRG